MRLTPSSRPYGGGWFSCRLPGRGEAELGSQARGPKAQAHSRSPTPSEGTYKGEGQRPTMFRISFPACRGQWATRGMIMTEESLSFKNSTFRQAGSMHSISRKEPGRIWSGSVSLSRGQGPCRAPGTGVSFLSPGRSVGLSLLVGGPGRRAAAPCVDLSCLQPGGTAASRARRPGFKPQLATGVTCLLTV